MRVAYICADPGVPVFGCKGSSVHVQEVIRALAQRGCEVTLFAARFDNAPPTDLAAVRLYHLPSALKGNTAAREQAMLAANNDLRMALASDGPFDLVYERHSLWSYAGMEYAQTTGTPGVLEVNAPLLEEQAQYRTLVDRPGAERVASQVFGAARALIAVSEGVANYLRRFPSVGERVHVVPNSVNPDRFPAWLRPTHPAPGLFTVGFVGTLKPWHGLPVLVDAFERLHRQDAATRLLIVGDGPERETLEADLLARRLDTATHLVGAVTADAVPGWLASMDAAVAPYPPHANFYFSPLKVLEYMAAGRAVVASHIGQLADLIRHGHTGLLCPPGNPHALAAALETLKQSPEMCLRLGQAARETVRQRHTWGQAIQRILEVAGVAALSQPASEVV